MPEEEKPKGLENRLKTFTREEVREWEAEALRAMRPLLQKLEWQQMVRRNIPLDESYNPVAYYAV